MNDKERAQMIEDNTHLVSRVVRYPGRDREDLLSEGKIGLIEAVDKFDPDRGVKFSTYAIYRIRRQINRYLRDRSWMIAIPSNIQELNAKIVRVMEEQLSQNLTVNLGEISAKLGISEIIVWRVLDAMTINRSICSLDQSFLNPDSDDNLALLGSSLGRDDPDLISFLEFADLHRALAALHPECRQIIQWLFSEGLTQKNIAERLGVHPAYVFRIEKKILSCLRHTMEQDKTEMLCRRCGCHNVLKSRI